MNKKVIVLTSLITAVAVFILSTLFYFSPLGSLFIGRFSDSASDFIKLIKIENLIKNNYTGNYNSRHLMDRALHTYVETLGDPYTDYLNSNEYEYLNSHLKGEYNGIGITVSASDGEILIKDVKDDSPAMNAGIMVGDILIAVNGTSYNAQTLSQAVDAIKSVKQGESINLTVSRNETPIDISVNIEKIEMVYVRQKMLEPSIGYIRLESFGQNIVQDFSESIQMLTSDGMQALILDLRSNPGGALESAVDVADLLIGEGTILTVRDKSGNEDIYTSDEGQLDMPIYVLINEESASASEVVAGALRDYDKAVLVGKKSFGKGVVQSVYGFGDGSGLRLTTAKYYTPSGECIQGTGIHPDIEVDLPEGMVYSYIDVNEADDTQLAAAINEIKNSLNN